MTNMGINLMSLPLNKAFLPKSHRFYLNNSTQILYFTTKRAVITKLALTACPSIGYIMNLKFLNLKKARLQPTSHRGLGFQI